MNIPAHDKVIWRFWLLAAIALSVSAQSASVRHPNLLLNRQEIEQVKLKVQREPWAAALLERIKSLAEDSRHTEQEPRDAALVYALTGDRYYAGLARQAMLGVMAAERPKYAQLDIAAKPEFGSWGPWAPYAWAYDLAYDTFSEEERESFEQFLRTVARTMIAGAKIYPTAQGLVFEQHWKVALIGFCLGDRELIDWGLHDPGSPGPHLGGIYPVLDANVRDRLFWSESPRYGMGTVLHGFLAVAEAALHYDGTDLYHYISPKSGGSIQGLLDGYLRITYPREKTGIHGGSLRLVTFGDGSTGYTPTGQQTDTYIINPVPGGPKAPVSLNGEFEIAYKRYREPGYAWLLSLNPQRDGCIAGARSVWGYAALTHGEPLPPSLQPPPAPSGVYPSQGLAVLRADESPGYWTNDAIAAVMRLGASVGHGHNDYFHLLLHARGRLLYPTIQLIQYEPNYMNWTREGQACNLLLVDHQSPGSSPCATRQALAPEAKFFALTGSPFKNVIQTRALLVTPQYAADVFHAADNNGRRRTFDWTLHGLGRLYPGNPAAYRPTSELVPYYWWIDNERGRTTDATWQADWVQCSAGVIPGAQPFGPEWFAHSAGVRLTMLGHRGTEVYCGDGPIVNAVPYAKLDGNPEGSVPMVVARRQDTAATFAAIHEPYEKQPSLRRVASVGETNLAIGLLVEGGSFSDRVLIAFGGEGEQTLGAGGEFFRFRDHAYLRLEEGRLTVRGPISAFRIRTSSHLAGPISVTMNGRVESARVDGDYLAFGSTPLNSEAPALASTPSPSSDAAEGTAAIHCSFLPEEVHLSAGGERETVLHLRCVGRTAAGGLQGQLRFLPPKGLSLNPATVEVTGMSEGDERDLRLRVTAEKGLASDLYPVRIEPAGGAAAAPGELPVSVGVVITTDRRLPLLAQSLIRAPGYTLRLDHRSGVSYYLLDADGHRRHGNLSEESTATGFFAVADGEQWVYHYYQQPCRFVFEGGNSLILVNGGTGPQVRLRYTFHEDRIVVTLVPPTDPHAEYEMWLGSFDTLGPPLVEALGAAQKGKDLGVVSPCAFFRHPIYRQGLFIAFPEERPVFARSTGLHFPVRRGEDVVMRFTDGQDVPPGLKEASGLVPLAKGSSGKGRGGKGAGDKSSKPPPGKEKS